MKTAIACAIGFFGPVIALALVIGFFSAIGITYEWFNDNAYPIGDFWRGVGLLFAVGIIATIVLTKVFP